MPRIGSLALALLLATGMTACDSQASSSPTTSPTSQALPIEAHTTIDDQTFQLEVARTTEQLDTGLMGRTSLPANQGMLFVISPERAMTFWMKNTDLGLDIIFLRNGIVTDIVHNAAPCQQAHCPTYSSPGPVDQVIELNAGQAKSHGLAVGDSLPVTVTSPHPS